MAAASENITAWLDWDDHLLDFLLIGWIGWAALVVVVVNSVLTFFGPLQPRGDFIIRTKEGATGAKVVAGTGGAESCQWLNSALNWFYLHYDQFPDFVDVWVKALNDQSVKLGGPVQVKFERVKSGSLPPKFSEVTFEAGPEDKYVVTCKTDSRDLSLAVFASQQTAEGVKLTNLTTNILKLKGTVKMKCFREGSDMMVNVSFEGRPDVKVVGKPVNPYQDPNDLVDVGVVETVVRNAICLTSSNFNISKLMLGGSYGNLSPRTMGEPPLSPGNLSPRTEAVFEPIEVKETQQSAFHAPSLASAPMMSSAPRPSRPAPGEKRLLVKVIKASALGGRDVGSIDPTCVVILDNPSQTQATSVVKSTVNPFWDEQFLFDVTNNTRELKFEVKDRRRPAGENFLGEAYVYFEDLKRTPSSRQIIPLQGSPDIMGDMVTGSLTVEFLFLDPVEAEAVRQTIAAMSPKRTVEVNQAKTPGGTLVTKTTTTTERTRHGRQGAQVDGSPNYIEKHTNVYDYDGSDSASLPQDRSVSSSSEHLHINGVESVAETAIRELMDRSRKPRTPTKTSTLIITGVKRDSTEPSEEVAAPPSEITVAQADSSPVEETTVTSDAVVEHFQQSSNLTSSASHSLPTSECSFKPEISDQVECYQESSFPKFTPIGMHPPAEVKYFPDKKKSTSPDFETENKILEMLSEPTPTIDLLDKNVVFEVTYSLGDDVPELSESLLDSITDIPTEGVQHKPDSISESDIESGHDASSEIPAESMSEEVTSEVPRVSASIQDGSKEVTPVVAKSEIESSQVFGHDTSPEPVEASVPEIVDTHKEVDKEICEEAAPDSMCAEVAEHSHSPSPFGDDSSCSSFHDDEYISHSSTEDLTESAPSHYFKSEEIDAEASEQPELSTNTEGSQSVQATETFPTQATAAVEPLNEVDFAVEKCTSEPTEETKDSPGLLEKSEIEPKEYAAVTSKVFTPEPSAEPEQLEEVGFEPSELLEVSHEVELTEGSEQIEYPAVTAKVFTPEPSDKFELTPEPESIAATIPPQHSAVTSKVFPESVVYTKGVREEQTEAELAEHVQCSSSENIVLTEVEPSKQFVEEEETTSCPLLPAERLLAAQKVAPTEAVLTETLLVETALSTDGIVSIKANSADQCLSETAKTDDIVIVTEVEPSEQIITEETLSACPPVPTERLLAAQKVSAAETALYEMMPEQTVLPGDDLVQTELESSGQFVTESPTKSDLVLSEVEGLEQIDPEEMVSSCPAMPAERLLAAQKLPQNEAVLSETMPIETALSADNIEQIEKELPDQRLSETAETDSDIILTEVEPSEQIVSEETTIPCSSVPVERLLASQAFSAIETVISETLLKETMLSGSDNFQTEMELGDQFVAERASEGELILTEVDQSKQISPEETVTSCSPVPADRLLAAQKESAAETVLSEVMPAETVLSEVLPAETVLSEVLPAETVLSEVLPAETSLSVGILTVDVTDVDVVGSESDVKVEEPLVIHTSKEIAAALEEPEQPANFQIISPEQESADSQLKGLEEPGQSDKLTTKDKILPTEEYYRGEDDLSDYDDLPDDIPSDFLMEDMTEELVVETEELAKFPVALEDEPTDTYQDFEPVVMENVQGDWEKVEAEDKMAVEITEQCKRTSREELCTETDPTASDLVSVDHPGGKVEDKLESDVPGTASDASLPGKPTDLDLVSSPLLEEMEQIASDMSLLAEDISKSPVLALNEFPFEPSSTTEDLIDQSTTKVDIADEASSPDSCHSADVSMARASEEEMPVVDKKSIPKESLTPTLGDLECPGLSSDTETEKDSLAVSADESTVQLSEPQATEETALDFSLGQRGKLTSISSVSEIIQDLPAHSSVIEQEPIVVESSAVSVDVVAVSDPTQDELSAVDNLLQEVSEYSQLQDGSSDRGDEGKVYLTGQFVSDPVDEAELAAEACGIEDDGAVHVAGLKVNVFVTADEESPEPSSPLTKYDVVEDLSVSVDESFTADAEETVESSGLRVDAVKEDTSTVPDVSFTPEAAPPAVATFVLPADTDQKDSSTKLDVSSEPDTQPAEEVTLSLPALEAETPTELDVSTQDDDSPTRRALLRRQNYLAEQAKKKELFEGSGHIEHKGAVDLCEKPIGYPTDLESTTPTSVETQPRVQPSDTVPKTIVVQVESTDIAGPPKELVSDLMTDNRRVTSPERYASLSRPLRVYKQVSSDIEDDNSKVVEKRVDEWVTATTNNVITTPAESTVQTSLSEDPPSLSQVTESIQITLQPQSENVQNVPKPSFVIQPQSADNVKPPSEYIKVVQRPGFAISRQTVENIQTEPQVPSESSQIVPKPGYVIRPPAAENVQPPSENVKIVQRPGFAISRQTVENIQTEPQVPSESSQIVPKPGYFIRPPAAENVQPPSENVKIVQRPGFAISRQTADPKPPLENIHFVQRPGFVVHTQTVQNIQTDPQSLSENIPVIMCPGTNLTPQSETDTIEIPDQPEPVELPPPVIDDTNVSPEPPPDVKSAPASGHVFRPKRDYNTLPRSSKSSKDASTPKRAGSLPRSSSAAERQRKEPVRTIPTIKTTQSSPTEEGNSDIPTVKMDPPPSAQEEKEKKKGSSLARTIKKRFSRSKKRSKSAERSRDDSHLQPPGQSYGQAQSKDDIELVRAQPETPSLKKSRSLGGSLKKLFRRGRKRSRDRGETSRESSYSRSSTRNASQGPSREGSLTRGSSGQTSSLTRSGQLPDQKGEVGRSHWSRTNTQSTSNEYMEREVDVSPRHHPGDTTYPVLQQEPTVLQPRGISSHEPDVGRGHWSRPKSGEQLDIARHSYDTHSAPPEVKTETEDVRRGHWSKSKSPARGGTVIITSPKQEPLDVVSPSYDTMAAPPDPDSQAEVGRGHWSKSKSPTRSTGGVVITSRKSDVPDLVPSSNTITPEVNNTIQVKKTDMINGKTKSSEKLDVAQPSEDKALSEPAEDVRRGHWSKSKSPVRSGPVIVTRRESAAADVHDKPDTTGEEVSDPQPDVRRGHWSKSKSPSRERIGQIVLSKDPSNAASAEEADVRKGHWTKSKSRSPRRESSSSDGLTLSAEEVKPTNVSPSNVESSDKVKVKAKPAKVDPVKSKPVKVVPVKAKPTKVESTVKEPVRTPPEEPIVAPPPSAKKGHWSKSTTDSNQPAGGGVVVVATGPSATPEDPVDVRRGHWTKPKTQTS